MFSVPWNVFAAASIDHASAVVSHRFSA